MTILSLMENLDPQQLKLVQIFHSYAFARMSDVTDRRIRFVHYTTAEAAIKMIDSREVWMRKSSCMNDFMEVEHGFECLNAAYKKYRERSAEIFHPAFPDFCGKLETPSTAGFHTSGQIHSLRASRNTMIARTSPVDCQCGGPTVKRRAWR